MIDCFMVSEGHEQFIKTFSYENIHEDFNENATPIELIEFSSFLNMEEAYRNALISYIVSGDNRTFYRGDVKKINKAYKRAREEYKDRKFDFFGEENRKIETILNKREGFKESIRVNLSDKDNMPEVAETESELGDNEYQK